MSHAVLKLVLSKTAPLFEVWYDLLTPSLPLFDKNTLVKFVSYCLDEEKPNKCGLR